MSDDSDAPRRPQPEDPATVGEPGGHPPPDMLPDNDPADVAASIDPASPARHADARRADAISNGPPMIVVHHLNNSRSQRVLWLLEELGCAYAVKRYERDRQTMLAPAALRAGASAREIAGHHRRRRDRR